MKKITSFLCRMPGIFLITLIILGVTIFRHWDHLDERWWLPVFMAIVMTLVSNFYLFFIQGEKTGYFIKGSKWIPVVFIGTETVLAISWIISSAQKSVIDFPDDHAVQAVLMESFAGVLIWAWFALFWNVISTRHEKIFKTIPPSVIKKRNKLLSE